MRLLKYTLFILSMVILTLLLSANVFAFDKVVTEFEQPWSAGSNVGSVTCVSSYANAPTTPYEGEACIEAGCSSVAGNVEKIIYVDSPSTSARLYPILSMKFNSWGGCPGATAYYAKITVTARDGYSVNNTTTITPNQWNSISIDLRNWEDTERERITKIEVSFWTDSSTVWTPSFQIDDVKFSDTNGNSLIRNYQGAWKFELPWSAGANVTGVSITDTTIQFPWGGYESNNGSGKYMLQADGTGAGNLMRTVYRNYSPAVDWSDSPILCVRINTTGGAPGAQETPGNAPYKGRINVYSGANVFTVTKPISSNGWDQIEVDLSNWSYRDNITKIEAGMWAETTQSWNNSFQIDDIRRRPSVTFPVFSASSNYYADQANKMTQLYWFAEPGLHSTAGSRGFHAAYWSEWETIANTWVDTDANKFYGEDANAATRNTLLSTELLDDGHVLSCPSYVLAYNLLGTGYAPDDVTNKGWRWETENWTDGWTPYNTSNYGVSSGRWLVNTPYNDPQLMSPDNLNIVADNSSYMAIRMSNTNSDTTAQVYFTTTTDTTWTEAKSVTFTIQNDGQYHVYYVPMKDNTYWRGTIKQIRFDPVLNGSTSGSVRIENIWCCQDERWFNESPYICASANYFYWTRDVSFLQSIMPNLRKALHYMNTVLQGDTYNYIYCNWWRRDGTGGWNMDYTVRYGYGLCGGYWDILPTGNKDFYATVHYYAALKDMANLEKLVEDNPSWGIASNPYNETSTVNTNHATSVYNAVVGTNTFWNTTTLRYVPLVDINNDTHDYGYTDYNLEALYYGLGNTTRATNIFDWLDGVRTVTGDTSTGSDIYAYAFAPRASTKQNPLWYSRYYIPNAPPSSDFGNQVQNGGAIMFNAYYDVMARLKYKGTDNAWTRFKAELDLFKSAQDEGGFRQYYLNRGITPQGAALPGAVGVDSDLTESGIAPLPILYGFMGINADMDAFVVAPSIPTELTWMQVTNINYCGSTSTVYVSTTQIRVTIDIPSGTQKLKFGSLTPNTQYTVQKDSVNFTTVTSDSNGYITFTTSGTGSHEYKVTR